MKVTRAYCYEEMKVGQGEGGKEKKKVVNACEKEIKRSKKEENYWCIK